jgi:hypothetical protein
LKNIGAELNAAHAAAAGPTTGLLAAGADEVSAAVAALFAEHGQAFQALSAQASAFHAQFVQALSGAASAYAAAEAANASPLQAVVLSVSGAVAKSPVGSVLSSASSAASSSPVGGLLGTVEQDMNAAVGQAEQKVINVINAPTELLLGRPLISTGSSGSLGAAAATSNATGTVMTSTSATVPLTVVDSTEPVVNASVGSGPTVPLLVDTGSTGLVIPYKDAGGILGLLKLGLPSGIGMGGYSGGLNYLYVTYNTTVNFGGGLVTQSTPVDLELFAWPSSLQSLLNNGVSSFSFPSFFASDGATGVLGVGPNAGGPGTSIPTQGFANPSYDTGLLINEPAGTLTFGPNPLTPIATLGGSPVTGLEVSVNGGTPQLVDSIIDSGGVYGTIPSSVIGNAPTGTPISVFAPGDPTALYSYTYGASDSATAISSGLMNTGALLFLDNPVYISYSPSGTGTTFID